MLRAFLFIAVITSPVGSAPAQELDGRLKHIYEAGTIKLAYRSDANPFSFASLRGSRMAIRLIFANLSRARSNAS